MCKHELRLRELDQLSDAGVASTEVAEEAEGLRDDLLTATPVLQVGDSGKHQHYTLVFSIFIISRSEKLFGLSDI
jgi:hypothetical protein